MTRAADDAERSDEEEGRPMTSAADDAAQQSDAGARPHKWEVPPPACGGEGRP